MTGPAVTEGRLVRLGPRSHAVESTPEGAANAGLVVGDEATLVIDSRLTPELGGELLGLARALGPARPVHLVNTHFHGDHCFGNGAFAGCLMLATTWTRDALANRWAEQVEEFVAIRPHQARAFRDAVRTVPRVGLTGALQLDLGGVEVTLRSVGHGHTPGDLVVEVPSERVVYTGDLIFHGHWPVLWDADVRGWLAALESLSTGAEWTVVPGHGPHGDGTLPTAMADCLSLLVALAAQGSDVGADHAAVRTSAFARWHHPGRVEAAVQRLRDALDRDPTLTSLATSL